MKICGLLEGGRFIWRINSPLSSSATISFLSSSDHYFRLHHLPSVSESDPLIFFTGKNVADSALIPYTCTYTHIFFAWDGSIVLNNNSLHPIFSHWMVTLVLKSSNVLKMHNSTQYYNQCILIFLPFRCCSPHSMVWF